MRLHFNLAAQDWGVKKEWRNVTVNRVLHMGVAAARKKNMEKKHPTMKDKKPIDTGPNSES